MSLEILYDRARMYDHMSGSLPSGIRLSAY